MHKKKKKKRRANFLNQVSFSNFSSARPWMDHTRKWLPVPVHWFSCRLARISTSVSAWWRRFSCGGITKRWSSWVSYLPRFVVVFCPFAADASLPSRLATVERESRTVVNTNFKVICSTRLGIKPNSTAPKQALHVLPMFNFIFSFSTLRDVAFYYYKSSNLFTVWVSLRQASKI